MLQQSFFWCLSLKYLVLVLFIYSFLLGCSSSSNDSARPVDYAGINELGMLNPPSIPDLATGKEKPPQMDELGDQLETAGSNWLYGDGLGKTILNVGAVVLFPPYAIYLVGNAGLAMFGQDPLYVTDLLPEEPREGYLTVYDAVTSVPGMLTSTVAGEDFRVPERLQ